MRCPNCGNENPPDYVFCDECGARLQGGDDTGIAAQAPVAGAGTAGQTQTGDATVAATGVQAQQGYGADTGYGSSQGDQAQGQPYSGQYDGAQYGAYAGGDSGPMGAGASGAMDGDGGAGDGGYDSGQQATQATYGEDKGFGAGPSATSGTGVATSAYGTDQEAGAGTPLTEDTMQMDGPGPDEGWQPGTDDSDMYAPSLGTDGDQGSAMPGVVEMDDAGAQEDQGAAGYAPVASGETYSDTGAGGDAQAQTQAGSQGQGAWASQALNLLDRAQSALGRGDWAAFGSGMSELRSFLAGLGATASTAAWTAASAGASGPASSPTSAGATQSASPAAAQSSSYASSDTAAGEGEAHDGYNEPAYSGSASQPQGNAGSTPAVEPQAEAGTLGAQEGSEYGVDYNSQDGNMGGPGTGSAPDAGMAAGDVTTGPTAGAGVGMMSPGASQAAVGGVATSTNGASDNLMARLVIISTGAELPLPDQEEIMVGREDPSSGIFPDVDLTPYGGEEGGVSRRHARLLHISGDYFVEDLQSTNFTKLDGQRLPAHVRERLEDGARIDFGRVATIFRRS